MISIAKASKSNAAEVVRLIAMADEDSILALSGKDNINEALIQYEINFERDDVYFSYKNVFVAKDKNQIAGCILWFNGKDEATFSSLTGDKSELELESAPDEIYIDSLAVLPDYRGQGIAGLLVERVKKEARLKGVKKVALLANANKPYLKKLYQRLGFSLTSEVKLLNDQYAKMTFYTAQ